MANIEVIHAYRHLYRGLLRAVQFAKPASLVARDQLRKAFREEGAQFDKSRVIRTIRFFEAAARTRGLEHRVLKNLLAIAWYRYKDVPTWSTTLSQNGKKKRELDEYMQATAYKHYDMTVAMLNKTVGLCLR